MQVIVALVTCILTLLNYAADYVDTPRPCLPPALAADLTLVFSDDFDGDTLDATKWDYGPEMLRHGYSYWDDALANVDGEGHLVIGAEWHAADRLVHTGSVQTKGRFEQGYGYYETSIKLATAHGVWGGFWLMVGDVSERPHGDARDGVEIDVIESIGVDWGESCSALHWNGYGEATKTAAAYHQRPDLYDGNFHTFGVYRTPEAYIFYIDGDEVWRVTADECAICPEPGYMLLSLEAADWLGAGTERSIAELPDTMVVDYVRVWE